MAGISVLRVARFLAFMDAAIERSLTKVDARKNTRPVLDDTLTILCNVLSVAVDLITTIST